LSILLISFFFQAEDGIRAFHVTGVQTCALPILLATMIVIKPKFPLWRCNDIGRPITGEPIRPANTFGNFARIGFKQRAFINQMRSEERRVGKESRYKWWTYD